MIQVCDPPRQRQVRRLSAEEFFTLVRCGGAGFYRPCSEVLRMLTAGEAWGTAGAALLVLPLTADTAAAAALRNWLGRRQLEGGCLLTPRAGRPAAAGAAGAARPAGGNCRSPGRPAAPQGHGMGGGRVHRNGGSAVAAVFSAGLRAAGAAPAGKPCALLFAVHRLRARPHCTGVGAAGGQGTAGAAAGKGLCRAGQPPLRRQSCTGALSAERNGIT